MLKFFQLCFLKVTFFPRTLTFHFCSFQTMSRERQNYKNSKLALLCICVSLLAFIITFLSGITNRRQLDGAVEVDTKTNTIPGCDEHVEPDGGSCTAVAALLHFFLLATFTWTSLYGTQLVILVRTMRQYLPPFWTPLSVAVGWGTSLKGQFIVC